MECCGELVFCLYPWCIWWRTCCSLFCFMVFIIVGKWSIWICGILSRRRARRNESGLPGSIIAICVILLPSFINCGISRRTRSRDAVSWWTWMCHIAISSKDVAWSLFPGITGIGRWCILISCGRRMSSWSRFINRYIIKSLIGWLVKLGAASGPRLWQKRIRYGWC